jgi:hypothetical protein
LKAARSRNFPLHLKSSVTESPLSQSLRDTLHLDFIEIAPLSDAGFAGMLPHKNSDHESRPFATAEALLELGRQQNLSIANIVRK